MKSVDEPNKAELKLIASLLEADHQIETFLSRDEHFYVRAANPSDADPDEFKEGDKDPRHRLRDQDREKTQTTIFYLLASIKEYCENVIPNAEIRPLVRMMHELHSINLGEKPFLFDRPIDLPIGNAPTHDVNFGRLRLIIAIEWLAEDYSSLSKAVKDASLRTGVKETTLKSWVKDFRQEKKLPSAQKAYSNILDQSEDYREHRSEFIDLLISQWKELQKSA